MEEWMQNSKVKEDVHSFTYVSEDKKRRKYMVLNMQIAQVTWIL